MHIEHSASLLAEITDLVRRETFLTKQLSPMERFRLACRRRSIDITLTRKVSTGFTYVTEQSPNIVLSSRLNERHLEFVAFHELGHALLGPTASELEADLFSYLALKPKENLV